MTFEQWWREHGTEIANKAYRQPVDSFAAIEKLFRQVAEEGWNAHTKAIAVYRPPRFTHTYTYAICQVKPTTFAEIRDKLAAAGYQDQFHEDGTVIDMHGLAIEAEK